MLDRRAPYGLSPGARAVKRGLDITVAALGLAALAAPLVVAWVVATIDTRRNGIFSQWRVGRDARAFRIFKIRTMRDDPSLTTTVTRADDPRITRVGRLLRRTKVDELPQLVNVLLGQMSLVGPRPDVPGLPDRLTGPDRIVLSMRPGITGPATLAFRDEERLLAGQADPEAYNREVIFPMKVKLNREYVETYSVWNDLRLIVRTVVGR